MLETSLLAQNVIRLTCNKSIQTFLCTCYLNTTILICVFRVNAGTGVSIARSREVISLHKWHRVRLIRDKVEMNLYVDDQQVVTDSNKGSFTKVDVGKKFYLGMIANLKER